MRQATLFTITIFFTSIFSHLVAEDNIEDLTAGPASSIPYGALSPTIQKRLQEAENANEQLQPYGALSQLLKLTSNSSAVTSV